MRSILTSSVQRAAIVLLLGTAAAAGNLQVPKRIAAGSAFSIQTSGEGKGVLYIVGPAQVIRREVTLGENVTFDRGELHNAGHYTAWLAGSSSTDASDFDVVAVNQPSTISFLAKPSRLPVDLSDGISGVAYVFDVFHNLILQPLQVSFQLSESAGSPETRNVETRDGVAWIKINSAPKAGPAEFEATAGSISAKRVVQQVPGDPCNLRMRAERAGDRITVETDPVRDCRGNPVPDGTIITFTEAYNGSETTVDAPLKRSVAKTDLPARPGAVISVAAGVVMGNEIHWQEGR
jgi:hypothetical protein